VEVVRYTTFNSFLFNGNGTHSQSINRGITQVAKFAKRSLTFKEDFLEQYGMFDVFHIPVLLPTRILMFTPSLFEGWHQADLKDLWPIFNRSIVGVGTEPCELFNNNNLLFILEIF
jgi:hypothetical protein